MKIAALIREQVAANDQNCRQMASSKLTDSISKQPRLALIPSRKGDPGLGMRSTKAVDKLPQAMLGATTKNNKLGCARRIPQNLVSLLLSTLPRIVHHPEHDAQRIYVLFMSWCLGRSKKGYVLFFWASPVLCLFFPGENKTRHPGKPHKKQDISEYVLFFSVFLGVFRFLF